MASSDYFKCEVCKSKAGYHGHVADYDDVIIKVLCDDCKKSHELIVREKNE